MEGDDRVPLLVGEPMVTRNQGVVLVRFAVPFSPFVELPAGDTDPADEPIGSDLRLLRPFADEVDD